MIWSRGRENKLMTDHVKIGPVNVGAGLTGKTTSKASGKVHPRFGCNLYFQLKKGSFHKLVRLAHFFFFSVVGFLEERGGTVGGVERVLLFFVSVIRRSEI